MHASDASILTAAAQRPGNIHLAEDQWYYSQRARPYGSLPGGARLRAQQELVAIASNVSSSIPSQSSAVSWTALGPAPNGSGLNATSGHVTALEYDASGGILYAGAAAGGLWKSVKSGMTWTPLTDGQASLAVGSIASDPNNPSTNYVGTGEANNSGDSYYGVGLLKSNDGGATWNLLGQSQFGGDRNNLCLNAYASTPTMPPQSAMPPQSVKQTQRSHSVGAL
jgi:hypothetical protein